MATRRQEDFDPLLDCVRRRPSIGEDGNEAPGRLRQVQRALFHPKLRVVKMATRRQEDFDARDRVTARGAQQVKMATRRQEDFDSIHPLPKYKSPLR